MTRSIACLVQEQYQPLPRLKREEAPTLEKLQRETLEDEIPIVTVTSLVEETYLSLPSLPSSLEQQPLHYPTQSTEEDEEEAYQAEPWPIPLEWISEKVPSLESRVCVRCRRRPGEVVGLVKIVLEPVKMKSGKTINPSDPVWWECLECHNTLEEMTVIQARYREWWKLMAHGNQDFPPLGPGHHAKIPNQETWLRATRNEGFSLSQLESSLDRYRSR